MHLPKARTADVLNQEAGRELLIYDLRTDKAYNLNETSKIIFNACGRQASFDELKREHRLTDEIVYLALDELRKFGLLEDAYDSPLAGMKRREIIRKIGLTSAIALPVISSIVAPPAARAASGNPAALGATCRTPSDCQSGNCSFTYGAGPPITVPGTPPTYYTSPPVTAPGPPINIGSSQYPFYAPGPPVTTPGQPVLVSPGTPPTTMPGPSTILYVCKST